MERGEGVGRWRRSVEGEGRQEFGDGHSTAVIRNLGVENLVEKWGKGLGLGCS